MLGIPVKYSFFYGSELPENPIDLIVDIPKNELIITINSINSRLKPIYSNHFDDSRETQIQCLKAVFLDNKEDNPSLFNCLPILNKFLRLPLNNVLFTRVTCLFAFQQILNCEDFVENIPKYTFDNRERIFKFLLIANDKILNSDENYKNEGFKELGSDFFEFFMFRELHHNQYNECSNAINIFYKSWYLLNKIENDEIFGTHFKNYLTWKYEVESIDEVLKFIIWSYLKSEDKDLGLRYLNVPSDNIDAIKVLDVLSFYETHETYSDDDLKKFDFLSLKKSPLYKSNMKDDKDIISYILLDDGFFLEKFYSIFINDFWFDYLKVNEVCSRKDWGNFLGTEFFESFIDEIFRESFSTNGNYILKSTSQLVFNYEGSPVEYADFYIRYKQNIALLEVKSGYISLDSGYKTVKTIEDYRDLDKDSFYKNFGLIQLAEKTIKKFHIYKHHIDDEKFNKNRKVQIYPIIVVNEPIISSSIATFPLKRKFTELLEKGGINKKAKEHNIKELIILNVSHLQDLEQNLKNNNVDFFNLLDFYLQISNIKNPANAKNYNFLRTFDHVLFEKVKDDLIADRVRNFNWLEI